MIFVCTIQPKAKIADRSGRAALHKPLLRTWTAFLTRCCSRVVFDPPVLPIVRCPHNGCQTMPLHQHRSTIFKHFRPQQTSPKFSFVKLRSVFCTVVLSTHVFGVRATVGKQQMCTRRARVRCQNLTSTMKHGVPTMWTTTTQSWPLTWQHKAFLDYLLDLADESKISAKDVCVLCDIMMHLTPF